MNGRAPTADELNSIFVVYGSFYDISAGRQIIPCRNVLEIIRKPDACLDLTTYERPAPYSLTPELLVVMMNPGSSEPRPLPGDEPPKTYELDKKLPDLIRKNPLVPAKPDITQYQIMKLMLKFSWRHARILNLSDIRQPKSAVFLEQVATFENEYKSQLHTIFSPERQDELQVATKTKRAAPVIAGWGTDKALLPLASQCKAALVGRQYVGIETAPGSCLYGHPSPLMQKHKDLWLETIEPMIAAYYKRQR